MKTYTLPLSQEALRAVRARFNAAAAKSPGFYDLFPDVRAAVDGLPDPKPIYLLNSMCRDMFTDALRSHGVTLPPTWGECVAMYGCER